MQSSRQQSLESIVEQYNTLYTSTLEKLAAYNSSRKPKQEDIKRLHWIDTEKQKNASIDVLQAAHPGSYNKTFLLRRSKTPDFTEYLKATNRIKNKLCEKYPFIPYPLAYYVIIAINMMNSKEYLETINKVYDMDDILLKSARLMDTVLTTQQKQIAQSGDTLITKIIKLFEKIKNRQKTTRLNKALQSPTETTSYGFLQHVSFIKLLVDYPEYVQLLVQIYPDDEQRKKYLQILLLAYNKSTGSKS